MLQCLHRLILAQETDAPMSHDTYATADIADRLKESNRMMSKIAKQLHMQNRILLLIAEVCDGIGGQSIMQHQESIVKLRKELGEV